MKRYLYPLLAICITGCTSNGVPPAVETNIVETQPICTENCGVVVTMPNGNDLMLETSRSVIHVTAESGVSYEYRVWTGDKTYDDDPDVVVSDGNAYVLESE